jgi:hypothetical protein
MILSVELARLNGILGAELGCRPDSHPVFAWKNSDKLFWPASSTGRTVTKREEIEIPIFGGGTEKVAVSKEVPEYRSDRQMAQRNVWVMTKWLSPEDLIFGSNRVYGGRGDTDSEPRPTHETLVDLWNQRFPGSDFPASGWRIPCNAIDDSGQHKYVTLPSHPGGSAFPNHDDTMRFVACIREQTRLSFGERLQELYTGEDVIEKAKNDRIQDEIRDLFPAFLNPTPGKRSNFVSMPWSRSDRG